LILLERKLHAKFDVSDPNGPAAFRVPRVKRVAVVFIFLLEVFIYSGEIH
jgi:hypothetical protein